MANIDLNGFFRDCVKKLKAYHVDEFDCPVKLHANESPYQPPHSVLDAVCPEIGRFQLNRYPDPSCLALRKTLSRRLQVPLETLVIGNGSDELIQFILQIFCADGDKIIFPDPTFSMYSIIAQGRGLVPVPFPLNDHWDFRATDLLDAARAQRPRIAFLSYPNNPTGNCFSQAEVLRMVREFPGIVVVDEAYYDFTGGKTFLNHLADNNNLIILRSLSKIGLAALRVGYAVAHPSIIEQINKVRLPYNSNTVSQVLAEKTLEHFAAVEQQIEQTLAERRRMAEALSAHPELTVFPADANFILLRVRDAQTLFQQMAENGVLVRHLGSHPRLLNCLRVTIGARAENDRFLLQMETLLRAKSLHE